MRRDKQIVFRVNRPERQALEGLARRRGLLVSEFLRELVGEAVLESVKKEAAIR